MGSNPVRRTEILRLFTLDKTQGMCYNIVIDKYKPKTEMKMKATFKLEDETHVTLEGTPFEITEVLNELTESPDEDGETPSWFGIEYLSSHKGWINVEDMNLLHVFNAVNKILRIGYRNGETLQEMIEADHTLEAMLDRISAEGHLLGSK